MEKDSGLYWIRHLGLSPHEEGGWFKHLWTSEISLALAGLPEGYGGDRGSCSLIYYLLRAGEVSCWHQLRSPELWLWQQGGTLLQTQGGLGEAPTAEKTLVLGPRPEKGEALHLVVPQLTWQTTRVAEGDFVLVSCVVSPAYHQAEMKMADMKMAEESR